MWCLDDDKCYNLALGEARMSLCNSRSVECLRVCACMCDVPGLAHPKSCSALDRWVTWRAEGWMELHWNTGNPHYNAATLAVSCIHIYSLALVIHAVCNVTMLYITVCPGNNWQFAFNVKFYPPDPSLLTEDITRYTHTHTHMYIQYRFKRSPTKQPTILCRIHTKHRN